MRENGCENFYKGEIVRDEWVLVGILEFVNNKKTFEVKQLLIFL